MIYRIVQSGTKWQAQIKGAHNWIALQDGNGDDCLYDTEEAARCAIESRIKLFGEPRPEQKHRLMCATEVR